MKTTCVFQININFKSQVKPIFRNELKKQAHILFSFYCSLTLHTAEIYCIQFKEIIALGLEKYSNYLAAAGLILDILYLDLKSARTNLLELD